MIYETCDLRMCRTQQAETKRQYEDEQLRQVADEVRRTELVEAKRREAEAEKEVKDIH